MKSTWLLTVLFPAILLAGTPERLRVNANVVLINATVLDRHDRLVRGLTRDHFRLYEDHAEQRITYFTEEDTPVSVAIIFDASGSMKGKIGRMRAALDTVLQEANPGDEFALVTFSTKPHLALGWTLDAAAVQNRLLNEPAHGETALLDALKLGLEQMKHARNTRKALLIFSDGGDNHSRLTEREFRHSLEESGVQIYALDDGTPATLRSRFPEELAGPDLLGRICDGAGGRYFQFGSQRDLAADAEQIGRELRSQYVLGYVPAGPVNDGRFHNVRVQLKREPGTHKLSVFWRRGYRAPQD